jgi:hypothetical protein
MRSEEARIGEAIAVLAHRLAGWGDEDERLRLATDYVRDMVRQGWRPRALPVETPARPPQADAVPADAVPTYRQARAALNTPGDRP